MMIYFLNYSKKRALHSFVSPKIINFEVKCDFTPRNNH